MPYGYVNGASIHKNLRARFKPTHGDMVPLSRYLVPEVSGEELIWQDSVCAVEHELINEQDAAGPKHQLLASGLSVFQLVLTACASAAAFRGV